MKKALLVLLALTLLPLSALAQAETWTDPKMARWQLTVFEGDDPQISSRLPQSGDRLVRGAYVQYVNTADDTDIPESKALLLLEGQEGYFLAGLMWRPDQQDAHFQSFGNLGLALDEACPIRVYWRNAEACFTLGVGSDTWEWIGQASGYRWYLAGYLDGVHQPIRWAVYSGYFYLGDNVGYRGDREHSYPAAVCMDMAYLQDVSIYPKTEQQMMDLAQASLEPYQGWAVVYGANLRTQPTGKSPSQGQLQAGVLVKILSQQPGTITPWYQVQVGDLQGWVSGDYVSQISSDGFAGDFTAHIDGLQHDTVTQACPLFDSINGNALLSLDEGQPIQILLIKDDWAYVAVPQSGDTYFMDTTAPTGWIQG